MGEARSQWLAAMLNVSNARHCVGSCARCEQDYVYSGQLTRGARLARILFFSFGTYCCARLAARGSAHLRALLMWLGGPTLARMPMNLSYIGLV